MRRLPLSTSLVAAPRVVVGAHFDLQLLGHLSFCLLACLTSPSLFYCADQVPRPGNRLRWLSMVASIVQVLTAVTSGVGRMSPLTK